MIVFQQRLRGLLEALKQDLGVQSSRSKIINTIEEIFSYVGCFHFLLIEPDTYASVHKATNFDNEPLPPPSKRDDLTILTPKTLRDDRRGSNFDINEPLPWQSEMHSDRQPTSTRETKRNSFHHPHQTENPMNDDYLFSPTSASIKPKPRLSLQTKTDDHFRTDEIPHSSTTFEHEPRISKPNLLDTDWLSESKPTRTTTTITNEENFLDHVTEEDHHTEERSPSPPLGHERHHLESNSYESNDFDDNDISDT